MSTYAIKVDDFQESEIGGVESLIKVSKNFQRNIREVIFEENNKYSIYPGENANIDQDGLNFTLPKKRGCMTTYMSHQPISIQATPFLSISYFYESLKIARKSLPGLWILDKNNITRGDLIGPERLENGLHLIDLRTINGIKEIYCISFTSDRSVNLKNIDLLTEQEVNIIKSDSSNRVLVQNLGEMDQFNPKSFVSEDKFKESGGDNFFNLFINKYNEISKLSLSRSRQNSQYLIPVEIENDTDINNIDKIVPEPFSILTMGTGITAFIRTRKRTKK